MAYHKRKRLDKDERRGRKSLLSTSSPEAPSSVPEFYELEPAVVLHVILDENDSMIPQLESSLSSRDYSYIGRIQCRPIYSHEKTPTINLPIAIPLETNITEYPLKHEMVVVVKYLGRYYYTRKLGAYNQLNTNFDYLWDREYTSDRDGTGMGGNVGATSAGNANTTSDSSDRYRLGEYFEENINIHPLRPFEGDLTLQSRFGSSIRFGAYNTGKVNPWEGEHPQILIRNRQNPEFNEEEFLFPVEEDVNDDGSSIHITSGQAQSQFVTEVDMEIRFNTFPSELKNDMIVINSGRLILQSREFEMFGFGKKTIGWVTDGLYTVDSKDHQYFNTPKDHIIWSTYTRVNSDKIYLGEEFNEEEPVVLGESFRRWLEALLDIMAQEIHPTPTGPSGPPVQGPQYQAMKARIPPFLSRRVFTV